MNLLFVVSKLYIKKLEMLPVDADVVHEASVVPGPGSTRSLIFVD